MAQDHHQACAELLGSELDAADEGWGDDVAGDANDEQIAQPLIKDNFDGYTGVGTAKNGGEWLLAHGQLGTPPPALNRVAIGDVRHETAVPFLQERKRFASQDHR